MQRGLDQLESKSGIQIETPGTIILDSELKYLPLNSMFPCSTSKVMDFMITFHRYDYSISDIAKNSGLTFKTGLNEVRKLERENIIVFTRKVGKALMYKFNPDSTKAKSMRKLALDIAVKRAKN